MTATLYTPSTLSEKPPSPTEPYTRFSRPQASSLGAEENMESVMNLLIPTGTHSITELLDYIREGFRPQNSKLKGAGDPERSNPDIGAVKINETIKSIEK